MSGGITPGDPLRGGQSPPPPLWSGERPPGYTTAPPPGAGGPAPIIPAGVPGGRPVLAGWWRRAGAQVIDGIIVAIGAAILFVAVTAPFSLGFFAGDAAGWTAIAIGLVLAVLAVTVVAFLYAPALMARTNGRTLGRMATGIRVVRTSGQPVTFGFAMLREVAVKWLLVTIASSFTFGLAYFIDVLWPLWDEENRALHDFVVNTRTIRG